MKKILIFASATFLSFIPLISMAQARGGCATGLSNVTDFECFVAFAIGIINSALYLIIGFAVLLFMFGLLKYILAGGDEAKTKEARSYIIFGLIAIFVMMSVWGLVALLYNTFFQGPLIGPQFREQ